MAQQTQINGNRYSFVNISMSASNFAFGNNASGGGNIDLPRGCLMSINYTPKLDAGLVQGNQVTIVGRTTGYGTCDGDLEILVSEFDAFIQAISFSGQVPFMQTDFNLVVAYSVNDIDVRADELIGCRIIEAGAENAKGNDASTRKLKLSIARIKMNGVDAFADPST